MPMLESLDGRSRSPSPISSRSPALENPQMDMLKLKSPADLLKNQMDIFRNPLLLSAQMLALNPQLYAAQLAQLQAAQLMLARQQQDTDEGGEGQGGQVPPSRKRAVDHNSPLDLGSKQKHPRSSSPSNQEFNSRSERPLDLSGSGSPDMKKEAGYFNPLMPAGLLSFFNQLRPPTSSPSTPDAIGIPSFPPPKTPSPSPPARHHSPWQSQWINKTAEASKAEDVFKCVWCRESYQSLDALTTHMKEAKHHSMPYPMPPNGPMRTGPPVSSPMRSSVSMSSPIPSMASPPKPPIRDILKEQLPLPRKLVRGQDVWIGRADQQTRDILKCMGCGQSFRSLELLTKHMQETQHYKKVISHDQISAWKFPESQPSTKSHVNSVLTCKVCDKGHSTLKELSDHVVKSNHYTNRDGTHPQRSVPPKQAVQERKKALPVKKLLELERARYEVSGSPGGPASAREVMESGKLLCERCDERISIDGFISHIQQCMGKPCFLRAASNEPTSLPTHKDDNSGSKSDGKESISDGNSSILGSLEQLVKGNFQASSSRNVPISSPVTSLPQTSPIGKFSINNLFPPKPSPAVSPSNSINSKPTSPSSSRGSSILHPSLEKMLDSPIEHQPEGNPHSPERPKSASRNSPALSDKSRASPRSDDEKHIPQLPVAPKAAKAEGLGSLASLQKLCDDQKKTPKVLEKDLTSAPMSDPGAILAFSWACNQAVSSGDSAIKCPFCDTPFISKGAYRHHLSKMHFTKENIGSMTAPNIPGMPKGGAPLRTPSPDSNDAEESLQSKYQKYSQLAKQLSCVDNV